MSGMLGGGGTTTYAERLTSLKVQSSAQGVAIQMVWGRQRVSPNLLWFDDFVAIEHRETQGGKGAAGATQVSYTYKASVLMGLCAGPLQGIPRRVWRDKDVLTGGTRVLPPQVQTYAGLVGTDATVTVPNADKWLSTVSVGGGGIDFIVVAGVYTFAPEMAAQYIEITYMVVGETEEYNALMAAAFSTHAIGVQGQPPWGYLSTAHPDKALGYSGIAYVGAVNFDLANTAGLRQYSFEVDGRHMISDAIPDANPADVCTDLLRDPLYGAVPNATWLDDLAQYRSWCNAMGLYLSPLYTERKGVFEYIKQLADVTFAEPLWRVDAFTLVPLATEAIATGTGSFTPLPEHSSPVYSITDDDIRDPVEEKRAAPADRFNRVSVQYNDRNTNYAQAIEPAEDKAAIDAYGLIPEPDVFQAPEVARQGVAALVAQLRLRKILSVQGTYKFTLPVNFDLLDPLDIIAIQDVRINLDARAVRIVEIAENDDDGSLDITAEDVSITGAVTQASQAGGGFNFGPIVIDSTTLRPVLMPTAATGNVQQVWVGATAGVNWGGATLWVSETGTDYRQLGRFTLRARMGTLRADLDASGTELDEAHQLKVSIAGNVSALATVTQADVDAARSLTWVDGELLAYRDAELVALQAFDLSYLRRGLYGTGADEHDAGSRWMRLDEAILKVDVPAELLGKTMFLKATSRGLLGTTEQGLEEVSPVLLDVVAVQSRPAAPPAVALTSPFVSTYFEINFAAAARALEYEIEVRSGGVLLRSVQTSAQVFRYLYADAVDDGGAKRVYQLRVRGVNDAGPGPWITLDIGNPAPAAVEGIAASGTGTSRTLTWDEATETDKAGYRAWRSTVSGFDPQDGEGVQIYDGTAATAVTTGLTVATTYYVRVAAYDVWSGITADLILSDQFTFTT